MLKLTRFFYIHIAVFPLFGAAYFAHILHTSLMAYSVVAIHELFHLFAALLLGVRVKSVIVMPFGITLRLQDGYIRQPYKEVLVCLAGPFANVLMLTAVQLLRELFPWAEQSLFFFAGLNWAMLLLNLLPVLPLDGGRVLKAVLTHSWGFVNAFNLLRRLTRVFAVILFVMGGILLVVTRLNVTLLLIGGFLFFHILEENQNNQLILMKEILYAKDKLRRRGVIVSKSISALNTVAAMELVKRFSYNHFYVIHVIDRKTLAPLGLLTEAQVIDALTEAGSGVTLGEALACTIRRRGYAA